jgi:hypothetical protein
MKYEFTILNEEENIENIDKGKVWINIYNRDSQMLWAYSNIYFPNIRFISCRSAALLSQREYTFKTYHHLANIDN